MKYICTLLLAMSALIANAQIGYQVTLLDRATGEPRAGETVSVSVTITNSAGATIYSGTQTATSNDFGILSLSVGNATTFDNVDWSKLPLSISATVDGILIANSQILNVPVAEYARRTGSLTKEILCSKTWVIFHNIESYTWVKGTVSFRQNGSCTYTRSSPGGTTSETGQYFINGDIVVISSPPGSIWDCVGVYNPANGEIVFVM